MFSDILSNLVSEDDDDNTIGDDESTIVSIVSIGGDCCSSTEGSTISEDDDNLTLNYVDSIDERQERRKQKMKKDKDKKSKLGSSSNGRTSSPSKKTIKRKGGKQNRPRGRSPTRRGCPEKKGQRIELRLPIDSIPANAFQYVLENKVSKQKESIKKLRITRALPSLVSPYEGDGNDGVCEYTDDGETATTQSSNTNDGSEPSSGTPNTVERLKAMFQVMNNPSGKYRKKLKKHKKKPTVNNMRTIEELRLLFQVLPELSNLKELELVNVGAYAYGQPSKRQNNNIKSMFSPSRQTSRQYSAIMDMSTITHSISSSTMLMPAATYDSGLAGGGFCPREDYRHYNHEQHYSGTSKPSMQVNDEMNMFDSCSMDGGDGDDDPTLLLEKEYHSISHMLTKLKSTKIQQLTLSVMGKLPSTSPSSSSSSKFEENSIIEEKKDDATMLTEDVEESVDQTIPGTVLRAMAMLPTLQIVTLKCNTSTTLSKLIHFSKSLQELYVEEIDCDDKGNPVNKTKKSKAQPTWGAANGGNNDGDDFMPTYSMTDALALMPSLQPKSMSTLRILDLGKHIGLSEFSVKLLASTLCENKTLEEVYFTYDPQKLYGIKTNMEEAVKSIQVLDDATVADELQDQIKNVFRINNGLLHELCKVVEQNDTLKLLRNHACSKVCGITNATMVKLDEAFENNTTLEEFMFFLLRKRLDLQEDNILSSALLGCGKQVSLCSAW